MAERSPLAVTDTSPLILLAGIGKLDLLERLFEQVLVPYEVFEELVYKPDASEPHALIALTNVGVLRMPRPAPPEAHVLDLGEQAAIAVALEHPRSIVLLDEARARKIAASLGLNVRGTLAILLEAKRRGLIASVQPLLTMMVANGARFAPSLLDAVLRSAGEDT